MDSSALKACIVLNRHYDALAQRAAAASMRVHEYTNSLLNCQQHGAMKFREADGIWTCPGWDGEACPSEWDPEAA